MNQSGMSTETLIVFKTKKNTYIFYWCGSDRQ